jgi:glycosyltransferase involved in cell wall biosynthesis
MRVLLVGHDFDLSANDGISRYSYELYNGLKKHADVSIAATGRLPRPVRAFSSVKAKDVDIVHLMYPDVAKVYKGDAKMVVTWHDLRLFNKYESQSQARYKPKLSERFNIASSIIRKWTHENYVASDALLFNSSQTFRDVNEQFKAYGTYDPAKRYEVTNFGVDSEFLRARIWKGRRKDFAYMGSIHLKHKNLPGLLRVFDAVAEKSDARLHIFTSSPGAAELLESAMRQFTHLSSKNVLLHFKNTDSQIAGSLPKLSAYLQLTKHEGYGMSILCALAAGTNVLTLKGSTIPLETRKYAFKGTEAEVVRKALELAKSSKPAQAQAVRYARSFTWKRTVKETLAVYKKLL